MMASKKSAWDNARTEAIKYAQAFTDAGYHKQIVNRLLEPFCHINVVVTATEWSNFFALRCHPGAQPEMRLLAEAIRDAMAESTPRVLEPGQWHQPYVTGEDWLAVDQVHMPSDKKWLFTTKLSVARCARVSYLTQEGNVPSIEEDLALYDRLLASVPLHASPAEHQATPDEPLAGVGSMNPGVGDWKNNSLHGNLRGWCQYRKTLAGEN